jgi:hypothetical protein
LMWHHLLRHELPKGVAKEVVLTTEESPFHSLHLTFPSALLAC